MDDPSAFLKKYYEVPAPYTGVYVLGCFASHVTLYSQQVRALNLIYALHKAGRLGKGTRVAIIGAGAAGLTASVAAAHKGARVTLLEKFEDLMQLQQNNRQRWIHPYIYDWPYISDKGGFDEIRGDIADVPFLPWAADYAANVAVRIVNRWKALQGTYSIGARFPVRDIDLPPNPHGNAHISWTEERYSPPGQEFETVILAVGFGLEKHRDFRLSYWTEDDLDSGFHVVGSPPTWLVSGSGDGALIDLMRLCMRRFRHAEILQEFAKARGIEAVKADLVRIMQNPRSTAEEGLSEQFENELTIPDNLRKIVRDRIRKQVPRITWVTMTRHLYGTKTSVLNRLMVRIIRNHVPITHKVGATDDEHIRRHKDGFWVPIKPVTPSKDPKIRKKEVVKHFAQRVLIRHGPDSALESDFRPIWAVCTNLAADWRSLSINNDQTRKAQWTSEFFEQPKSGESTNIVVAGADVYRQYGIWAKAVTVYKDVRDDGSSTVTFEIKDLWLLRGELSGIHFYYQSKAGQIGPPRLRADPPQTKLVWVQDDMPLQDDVSSESADRTLEARERARRLSGIVRFVPPIRVSNQPVGISLTFTVQNGDALSAWEFDQMYDSEARVHMDKSELKNAIEYFARIVWFPAETLRLRISLPVRLGGVPYPTVFAPTRNEITPDDVVVNSVLQFSPTAPSKWRPTTLDWKPELFDWQRVSPSRLFEEGCFTMPASQTWELEVRDPALGSCYSLDWALPQTPENEASHSLAQSAKILRGGFLNYSGMRRKRQESAVSTAVRKQFLDLYEALHAKYGLKSADEKFQVQMMTYAEIERRLIVVDAVVRGGEPDEQVWRFSLPFGLGLAGSCFRQAQAFVYREGARVDADSYLPIPHGEQHQCLLALPLDHPDLTGETLKKMPEHFERSQQCIGVVNISSDHPNTNLLKILKQDEITEIRNLCQSYCDAMCSIFSSLRE